MRVVWKYTLGLTADPQDKHIPRGATIAYIGQDPASPRPAVWMEVDPDEPVVAAWFQIVGTGDRVIDLSRMRHIGSTIIGPMVWHIYMVFDHTAFIATLNPGRTE